MKTTLLVSAAAVFCSCSFAALPAARPLPAPRRTGGMPLQQALGVRKTIRSYKADALTDQQIADLPVTFPVRKNGRDIQADMSR